MGSESPSRSIALVAIAAPPATAEIGAAEHSAQREADFEAVTAKHNALARVGRVLYRLCEPVIDFAHRTAAVDDECARFNGAGLAGKHRRLLRIELTARQFGKLRRAPNHRSSRP